MFPGQPLACDAALPDDIDFADIAGLVKCRTGLDLKSFGRSSESNYSNQVMLQLLGSAMSLYRLRNMRKTGRQPDVVAEHSMGIYAALAACGSLPEAEVLELTWRIGNCLAGMGKNQRFAFGCVAGLTLGKLLGIADNNRVYLANHNTSRHFLLSGQLEAIESAIAEATSQKAFSTKIFPSIAPLHSPLITELEDQLQLIFSDYSYQKPHCPLMDHLEQKYLAADELAGFMLSELSRPVYWEKTFRALQFSGVESFLEIGMGDSLKKYNRWIEMEPSPGNPT
jgi:malonyl CoA-acyl carrier protein transacylase